MSKQYKKRVIEESDDEGDDAPKPSSPAPATASHAQAVATGSVLLKEAANGAPAASTSDVAPALEDAPLRQEIAASGFPVDESDPVGATGAHAANEPAKPSSKDERAGKKDDNAMQVDEKPGANGSTAAVLRVKKEGGGSSSSDDDEDDKPLASKVTRTNGSSSKAPLQNGAGSASRSNSADSSDDEDDVPLAARKASTSALPAAPSNGKKGKDAAQKRKQSDSDMSEDDEGADESSSDDDAPLANKINGNTANKKGKGPAVKREPEDSNDDDDSDEDEPLAKKARKKGNKDAPISKKRAKLEDDDSDFGQSKREAKKPKKNKPAATVKSESSAPVPKKQKQQQDDVKREESVDSGVGTSKGGKKGKQKVKNEQGDAKDALKAEDESDSEEYKWWLAQKSDGEGDDGPKWTTLEHNGVLFPPEYTPLPSNVKLKFDGKPVDLPPEPEEVAGFYAALLETDHGKDATFQKNFFKDFLTVLGEHPPRNGVEIGKDDFARLDFTDMWTYFETEKEKRKAMTKEEKLKVKKEKTELEAPFITCLVDGREEKVGNFRLEPPGLFRGRGDHPKKGSLKLRLQPEDITINIGKDAKVPEPPKGHKWGKVQHDQNVTWLATWKENINNNIKYVFLAAGSSWKGQSDLKKFEKARKLKDLIGRIRQDYEADLNSKVMADRQRATAVYFIDRFALRVGNEKGEDEADTVGCCSLRYEHVTLREPNLVTFDFLGKDSIRFYQPDKEVIPQVFKNLKLFKKSSEEGAELFDRINPLILNKFFSSYMKGLSAKVFRTYNASKLLQDQLLKTDPKASIADKILHYNRANRLVAELCNHQRAAAKNHGQAMEKLADKVRGVKYQRMKLRYTLWALDPDNKKKHKKYKDPESDMDDEWCEKHEVDLVEKEKVKIRKKFEKDNEKRKADGEKELSEKDLNRSLEEADAWGEEIKEERLSKRVEPKRAQTTPKVLDALVKIDQRLEVQKIAAVDKEEGKEISLTTSKINYMDPRVTVAWCKKHSVPIEKMLSKVLRTKFVWAMDVDEDWRF